MSSTRIIALDAMGGDRAPDVVLGGANLASEEYPGASFHLFGDPENIKSKLRRFPRLEHVAEVIAAEDYVSSEMTTLHAIRSGGKTSMKLAIDSAKDGHAAGVVSAGNTGALMAMAMRAFRTLPGIDRPAIASTFPTKRGESVMLDLGANIDCNKNNLVQFAVMGAAFVSSVHGMRKPSVGLLNVGHEDTKGRDVIRHAAEELRKSSLPMEFVGFIEGNDILEGTVDVVVTDGFSGNVALKTAEGAASLYARFLRDSFSRSLMSRLGYLLARPALKAMKDRTDPRKYNGGMFLGLNGVVVKSHGGTDARGFANAIGFALDMLAQGFNEKVIENIGRMARNGALVPTND